MPHDELWLPRSEASRWTIGAAPGPRNQVSTMIGRPTASTLPTVPTNTAAPGNFANSTSEVVAHEHADTVRGSASQLVISPAAIRMAAMDARIDRQVPPI